MPLVTLFLAGDVMTGRGIDQIFEHSVNPVLHESYVKDAREYVVLAERASGRIPKPVTCDYVWGAALEIWDARSPDARIVNLETSITTNGRPWPGKGIHYRMHPKNVACLSAAKLDCCVLANNHVMDWGRAGLTETLSTLRGAKLAVAGAGENAAAAARPARIRVPDSRHVLVFAFAHESSGVPAGWRATTSSGGVRLLEDLSEQTAARVGREIRASREETDFVVASVHWGGNWGYDVPREQQTFAHSLIDTGSVDVMHGHSSHHARPIEIYRGKPILYGCGDLLTDYEGIRSHEHYRPWIAPMYFATFCADSKRLVRLEIVPLRTRRFRLIKASSTDRQWLTAALNKTSATFGTRFELVNGHAAARLPNQ